MDDWESSCFNIMKLMRIFYIIKYYKTIIKVNYRYVDGAIFFVHKDHISLVINFIVFNFFIQRQKYC